MAFLELELGNTVAKQPSDPVRALEDRHLVPGVIQLIGRREACGTGADDRDRLPGAAHRRARHDPAFEERPLDDRELDALDRDRIVVDAEHARSFAWRRAEPARQLRKVVGRVQAIDRFAPLIARSEIVPVRNQIAERAALMAERNPAVHAPGALLADLLQRIEQVDLLPIPQPFVDRPGLRLRPLELDKAGRLTHSPPPAPRCRRGRVRAGLGIASAWACMTRL